MVMHQSWGANEVAGSLQDHGKRPLFHLADLGILGPNLTLVHMIQLDDSEVEVIAASGARVVHCPNASLRRGKGAFRVGRFPELLAAGVPVALGSDGMGGKRDMARQMHLAIGGQREVRNEYPVITGEQALEMATINGARAVGLADEIGSLEVGRRADIVIHTLDRPEAHPRWADPVDSLVFFGQSATVDTVLVDGEIVLDHGRFTRLDATDAYRRIDEAAAGFEEMLGRRAFAVWPIVD
jgi:cytosine/adenosine deaminase-related metal-dependent hydrolase